MSQPSRLIILDTETTGQDAKRGDRVIEIGCVELIDRQPTGKTFHRYINPEGRKSEPGALKVHGITDESLLDKPPFKLIADELIDFLRGAQILIHNADFDTTFLNEEFKRCGRPQLWEFATVECTYKIAHSFYPGSMNGLNKLCERLGVDNSKRTVHGALLDAELLRDVYLKMTADAEPFVNDEELAKKPRGPLVRIAAGRSPRLLTISDASLEAHATYLQKLEKDAKGPSVWAASGQAPAAPSGPRR